MYNTDTTRLSWSGWYFFKGQTLIALRNLSVDFQPLEFLSDCDDDRVCELWKNNFTQI